VSLLIGQVCDSPDEHVVTSDEAITVRTSFQSLDAFVMVTDARRAQSPRIRAHARAFRIETATCHLRPFTPIQIKLITAPHAP